MSIEELVNRAYTTWVHDRGTSWTDHMRAALTEQAKTHALELRAYEATVQNLEQRIEELTGVRLTVGDGLEVYGTGEAIRRAQAYILMDSSHPSEAKGTARHFASALQVAEQRIRDLQLEMLANGEAQSVPEGWIAVSERLPEPGKVVMAYYKNYVGDDRIICAFHAPKHTLEVACHDDESCFDYDEATDTDYMAEGWLEKINNWGEYTSIYVFEGGVTHWMPLPAAPAPKEGDSNEA